LWLTPVVVAHPECSHEVCDLADEVGSTGYIIQAIAEKPAGSVIAVATEVHLVNRLAQENPDKTIFCLDPVVCPCSTMSRIDLPHLAWILEGLVEGDVRNVIAVDESTRELSRQSLQTMLDITAADRTD
jgi:quinolinate synthase